MTVNQLIKKLEKIQSKHGKRVMVCFDAESIEQRRPEDFSHISVDELEVQAVRWSVDDSYLLANGDERYKTVVALK